MAWRSTTCLIAPLHLQQRPFPPLVLMLPLQNQLILATTIALIWWPLLCSLLHPPLSCPLTNPASSKCPGERNIKNFVYFSPSIMICYIKRIFFQLHMIVCNNKDCVKFLQVLSWAWSHWAVNTEQEQRGLLSSKDESKYNQTTPVF